MERMTDFTTITACGECCVGCSKKKDGFCPGCIESDGRVPEWAGSGMCKVHASFEELYRELPLRECGYTEEDIDTALSDDMEKFYSKEKQAQYGVVGIKISLI